ncbi:hypothetical protein ES332_D11G166100v1 [Gossypium tomentosum]|uniref:Serine aminopeptidase S33 domain-containing protein n=1 Tax=Gossypium tomentosum TaxID=34277 RepID=A0A5D2IP86_GOSTO|nr:hypothetical protein ES332_D11G166100v1 [Gossypium tomentosum]
MQIHVQSSFARFMYSQGYDTWIIELRGAGLSTQGMDFGQYIDPLDSISQRKDFYALKDMQKQLDLISKYDWDFDNYLEEDVPAVMEYIKDKSEPKDGKLLAIGHSMGSILLYAMLSRCAKACQPG